MTEAQVHARAKKIKQPETSGTPLWAKRLTTAFEIAGLTNKKGEIDTREIGRRFNVSYKTIESWTTGRTQPRFEKLMLAREITGFSLDWVLSNDATLKIPQRFRASNGNGNNFLKIDKKRTISR